MLLSFSNVVVLADFSAKVGVFQEFQIIETVRVADVLAVFGLSPVLQVRNVVEESFVVEKALMSQN